MAEISFDDVPFEEGTGDTADISFDDVPMEKPAPRAPERAIPVPPTMDTMGGMEDQAATPVMRDNPRLFTGSSVKPGTPVSPAAREPDEPDRSSALNDLKAGVKQAEQVIPGLQTAKGALDLNEAEYDEARATSAKQRLAALDATIAELEAQVGPGAGRPTSQEEAETRERLRASYQTLMAERQQLQLSVGTGGPDIDIAKAGREKQDAVRAVVNGVMEINRLTKEIAAIPRSRQAEIFTNPYGETTGENLRSMWAAISSDPTGVVRDLTLRSFPSSVPTIIATVIGGVGGPAGAATMAGLVGGSVEMGASMSGYISEELSKLGIDPTDRQKVEAWAIQNLDKVLDMVGKSAIRAGAIAVTEGAVGGLSEKVVRNMTKEGATRAGKIGGIVTNEVLNIGGEGLGEAAAGLLAEGETSLPAVAAEMVGAAGQGSVTTSGQVLREAVRGPRVQQVPIAGGDQAETAALSQTAGGGTPPPAPTAPSAPPGISPDAAAALEATNPPAPPPPAPPPVPEATQQLPPAPPTPAPPTAAPAPPPGPPPVGPSAAGPTEAPITPATPTQAERIREIARARQAAAQAQAPQATAPQPDAGTAGAAEGPQAGGPPAAPTTPPVAETPPAAPAPKAEPEVKPPPKVRNFNTESGADILLSAGMGVGEVAALKRGEQGRVTGLIRSALRKQYTTEELNTMPREEYDAAVKAIYDEIKTAQTPVAPKPVVPKPTPKPKVTSEGKPDPMPGIPTTPEPPVAEAAPAPVVQEEAPPSIADAPSEVRKPTLSEEEKARLVAELEAKTAPKVEPKPIKTPEVTSDEVLTAEEITDGERKTMPGDRPTKAQDAIDVSEGRTGRVLKDVSEEGKKAEAAALAKAKAVAAKREKETKEAEERKERIEAGPAGAKMNPVEVTRRATNKKAATEIVQEFAPDNKTEKNFEDNTYEGQKAREQVWARAKRMMQAVEKRMAADDKGFKLPRSRKGSTKEDQNQQTAEMLLLKAAEALAKRKTPTAKAVADFKSAEALLRSGNIDAYMAAVRGDTDTANRVAPTLTTEEGESIDAAETLPDQRTTPEQELERAEEGRIEEEDYTPDDEVSQAPIEQERPKLVSEDKVSEYYSTPTPPKVPKIRTKLSRARIAEERAKLLTRKGSRKGNKKGNTRSETTSKTLQPTDFPHTKMTLAEATGSIDSFGLKMFGTKMGRQITERLLGRLREAIGDVEVFIVSDADMDKMMPDTNGFYDPNTNQITINEDRVYNGRIDAQLLTHEGLHALLFDAIEYDAEINEALTQLAEATAAMIPNAEQYYGFSIDKKTGTYDVHEFLTEALTDPDFQNLMAEIELPTEVAEYFGVKLDRSDRSVWGALRRIVRSYILKFRGEFGDNSQAHTVLDAIMRVAKDADELATGMRKIRGDKSIPPGPPQRVLLSSNAFKEWFGKSKVVTPEGKPLVVYHGKPNDTFGPNQKITAFDKSKLGSNTRAKSAEQGFFFTNSMKNAAHYGGGGGMGNLAMFFDDIAYADQRFAEMGERNRMNSYVWDVQVKRKERAEKVIQEAIDAGQIMPVYLSIQNPYIHDFKGEIYRETSYNSIITKAKKAGHDGVILKNTFDPHEGDMYVVFEPTQVKSATENEGTYSPVEHDIRRSIKRDSAPLSNYNQLLAGRVPPDVAREINDFLKAEIGKSVDPATVPLLIADYIAAFGVQPTTSAGNAPAAPSAAPSGGGVQPPYNAPPSPGMGPGAPNRPQSTPVRGTEGRISRNLRKAALQNMTLDFMRQEYGDKFVDANGPMLTQIIEAAQKRTNIADKFAEPINRIASELVGLMAKNPKEGLALYDLAMEATRLDVRLGKGADNSHLGKNAAKGLQGKRNLAALNQRFENELSDRGRDIYTRLTAAYRDAHNSNIEALVFQSLNLLDQKLSTGDVMYLMQRTVNGLLDANDATLINDPVIFNALKNAQELKVIKGDYFPQVRFGDHVVLTKETIDNPGWTSVPMKVGKKKVVNAPVKTELDGDDTLRVIVDPAIRGAPTAAMRALRDYASKSDLTLQGITTRFRDRQTGKLVSKGEQMTGRTYDTVYEAKFQTQGVHYFESEKDAFAFRDTAPNVEGDVLTRLEYDERGRPDGSVLGAIVAKVNRDPRLSAGEKKLFDNIVKNAIITSMDGNSARSRYQARRNVRGASRDVARAAVTYGQAAGHFHATLITAPEIRDGLERLQAFQDGMAKKPGGGMVSQVADELRKRMATIEGANEPSRALQTVATISYIDKLASPAYSIVNGIQPMATTMPLLAGEYGVGRANVAMANAYSKAGVGSATMTGLRNTGRALTSNFKAQIDLDDPVASIRKNLQKQHGNKYDALLDRLEELGAVSPDAGQMVAGAVEADASGRIGRTIGYFDRAARQLPVAVEAINRIVTAVAAYDLATSGKQPKSKADAIQAAVDLTFATQGDYRKMNAPRWMQHPALSWSLQFKKFAQMMYQLTISLGAKSIKGANKQQRAIARKQLAYLYITQGALAGAFGLSGWELIKIGGLVLSNLELGEGWDEEEEGLMKFIRDNANPTVANLIEWGGLSVLTGMNFQSRLSQEDMALGYLPKDMSMDEMKKFVGGLVLGAPGGTILDVTSAANDFAKGNYEKGLEKSLLVKQVSDIIKATRGVLDNKLGPYEAAGQAIGFQPLNVAKTSKQRGNDIRQYEQRKNRERDLRNDLIKALDRRSKSAQAKAISAIREYNLELKKLEKETGQSYREMNAKSVIKYYLIDKLKEREVKEGK